MSDRNVNLVNPQTGAIETVAPDKAQELFLGGSRGLVPGQQLSLTAPDGSVMDFPTDKVHGALGQGWRFSAPAEIRQVEAEARPVQAGLEGTAHGLTAGASTLMLQALGSEGIEDRAKTSAFQLGEGVGLAGSLFLPGLGEAAIASRAANAARVLTPAARLAAEAAATKAAGKAALAEIAGETATRASAAHLAATGAIDGGVYGAVGAMSEESLGNPEANVQSILAAGGMGALLGAGVGGGLGGVLGSAGDAMTNWRKARPALLDASQLGAHLESSGVEGASGSPIVKRFVKLLREDLPAMAGFDRNALRTVSTPEARAWIAEGEQTLKNSVRQTAESLDRVAEEHAALNQVLTVKPDMVREVSKTGNATGAVQTLDYISSEMRDKLAGIETLEKAGRGAKAGAAEVGRALDEAESAVFKSAGVRRAEFPGSDDPFYLSRLHKEYELPGKVAGETFAQLGNLRAVLDRAARTAPEEFKGLYREMADFTASSLEDSSVWGKGAADAQREMTAALKARDEAYEGISRAFPYDADGRVNRGAVENMARQLRSVKGDDSLSALTRWHNAYAQLADVAERHYVGGKDMAIRAKVAVRDFERTVEHLQRKQSVFNALDQLDRERANMGGGMGGAASWALGSVLGVNGLAAGAIVGTVANPSRVARVMAHTQSIRDQVAESLSNSATAIVHGAAAGAQSPALTRGLSRATATMIEAKTAQERQEAFQQRVSELAQLADPQSVQEHLNTATRDMADAIPQHASIAQTQATQALAYLQARLPAAAAPAAGGFAAMQRPLTPSAQEMLKFGRIDYAAQAPLAVIHEAARTGHVDHTQLQVIRDLYPEVAKAVEQHLTHEISKLGAGVPAARTRKVLEAFLGAEPGGSYLKRAQSVHAPQAAAKAGQGPAPSSRGGRSSRASSQQSLSQQLESR